MAKTLKNFLELYKPKAADEQKFVDKHIVSKHADRNGNGDDVFAGDKVKKIDRKKEAHGHEPGEDEKVYEEVEVVDEKVEIFHRQGPGADMERYKKDTSNPAAVLARKKAADAARKSRVAGDLKAKKMGQTMSTGNGGAVKATSTTSQGFKKEEVEQVDEAKTANPGRGYHGQHEDDVADQKYSKMHAKVRSLTGTNSTMAKHYLDSTHGRHLAGYENDSEHVKRDFLKFAKKYNADQFKEEVEQVDEKAGYSAKAAAAGKDIGKPGKQFSKIAASAAKKYGSKAAGERVAGAVLKKLRAEEKIEELLSLLNESNKTLMLSVFGKLTEENQEKFVEAIEKGGLNTMLDFAIKNRNLE